MIGLGLSAVTTDFLAGVALAIGVDAVNDQTADVTAREITGHKVNPANDKLIVRAMDAPGSGGANHHYEITGYTPKGAHEGVGCTPIRFQNGPIAEVGVNGLTHEALIAILIDRLAAFQDGPFASDYNGHALHHLREAQRALHARTLERMARNVEGTHTP